MQTFIMGDENFSSKDSLKQTKRMATILGTIEGNHSLYGKRRKLKGSSKLN
jgi:hypothetical protein